MRREPLRRLRELREGQSLSQAELAERASISVAAVVRLEHGQRHAWPKTARALADALGVPVDELYSGG